MKKKRTYSIVHLKRDISRTLNHFSKTSNVITMYEEDGWVIERFDYENKISKSTSGVIVYNNMDYKLNKEDTEYIVSTLSKMSEYKKHIEALISSVKEYEKTIDENICINYFFDIEETEAIDTINNKIQELYNITYSRRYLKQLYTTMRNYLKFPKIYEKDFYDNLKPIKKKTLYRYYFKTRFYFDYYNKYYIVNKWKENDEVIEKAKKIFKESEEYLIKIFNIFDTQYYKFILPIETEEEIQHFLSTKYHIENKKITIENETFDLEYIVAMYKDLQISVDIEVQERALHFIKNRDRWKKHYNIDVESKKPLTAREMRIIDIGFD